MSNKGDTVNDTTYNGWSNYPTWAVNLWLSNDEGLHNEALEIAADTKRGQIDGHNYPDWGIGVLAEIYKRWVRDDLAPNLEASFAADLLGYALDQVDWREIATGWLEAVTV